MTCCVSTVDTTAETEVFKINGGVLRMVLVCAVMFGYILVSTSADYVNGVLASVFSKASFAGARKPVKFPRWRMREEESKFCSIWSVR